MVESPNPGETANGTAKPVQTETGDKKSPDKKSPGVSQLLLLSLCLAIALAAIHSWCICRPTHDCDSPIDYNQYLSSRSSYEYFRGNELGKEHDEPGMNCNLTICHEHSSNGSKIVERQLLDSSKAFDRVNFLHDD